jgi:hypothetical protein
MEGLSGVNINSLIFPNFSGLLICPKASRTLGGLALARFPSFFLSLTTITMTAFSFTCARFFVGCETACLDSVSFILFVF